MFEYRANVLLGGILTASFLALVQFVTFDEEFALSHRARSFPGGRGGTAVYELCRFKQFTLG